MTKHLQTWLLFGLVMGLIQPASANTMEWLVLNPLGFEFFLRADATSQEADNDRGSNKRSLLDTGITILQRGYIADPGIARFNIELEPTYTTANISNREGDFRVSDTNFNQETTMGIPEYPVGHAA